MGNSLFIQDIYVKEKFGVTLKLFRLDLLHPIIQGNKYFKLLHNVEYALENKLSIVTMGGPHSNHINAAALICQSENIPCYGIIRGTNFKYLSPTLQKAQEAGMKLVFVDREQFGEIRKTHIIDHLDEFKAKTFKYHFIPEGGSNELGVQGAEEIINNLSIEYDMVFCPVGTGGSLAGIIRYLKGDKRIIGISALKDDYLVDEIKKMLKHEYSNWQVNFNYHFGGYAKWNQELIDFINNFKRETQIPLCPIYTGKMMYGILDLLNKNYFPKGSNILAIHTGGLQGIEGFNKANNNILI